MLDLLKPEISTVVDGIVGKKIMIYGPAGTGKTSNATKAPKPLVVCLENGLNAISGVANIKIRKWTDFQDVVKQLADPVKHTALKEKYECIIFDGVDSLESLVQKYICGIYGASSIGPGNNGYGLWKEYEQEIRNQLRLLDMSGFTLIFLGHADTRDFYDPTGAKYTKIYPKGEKRSIDPIIQMCDIVGYTQFDAAAEGQPVQLATLYVHGNSAFEAKTRFDYMPSVITNWNYDKLNAAIVQAIKDSADTTGTKPISKKEADSKLVAESLADAKNTLPIKELIKRISNMLIRMKRDTGGLAAYQDILVTKIGNPDFKCTAANENQREIVELVYRNLKDLGYDDSDVIE